MSPGRDGSCPVTAAGQRQRQAAGFCSAAAACLERGKVGAGLGSRHLLRSSSAGGRSLLQEKGEAVRDRDGMSTTATPQAPRSPVRTGRTVPKRQVWSCQHHASPTPLALQKSGAGIRPHKPSSSPPQTKLNSLLPVLPQGVSPKATLRTARPTPTHPSPPSSSLPKPFD